MMPRHVAYMVWNLSTFRFLSTRWVLIGIFNRADRLRHNLKAFISSSSSSSA